ncbi:4-hydroxy-tetrahydrodipicolinate reductase [Bacteroidota bacterium]
MNIAIIGYGKMGRMIESLAIEKGHTIGSCIDVDNQDLLSVDNLRQHDVAIEFTTPETSFDNVSKCLDAGLPVVSGSTGWTDRLEELAKRCENENGSFLHASNFSLGVNLIFYLNRHFASIMNRHEQYDVRMSETHHTQKLDAPSGTAISLAEDILGEIARKNSWSLEDADNLPGNSVEAKELLMIQAIREGKVAGIHEVIYESEYDTLSIRHEAKDRRGFAKGAILAAEFLQGKKGFFTMKEVLNL